MYARIAFAATAVSCFLALQCSEGTPSGAQPPQLEPGKYITVLEPNGGETYHIGDTLTVRWIADTAEIEIVEIQLTVDSGQTYHVLTSSGAVRPGDSTWGAFRWAILPENWWPPYASELLGEKCLVRACNYQSTGAYADTSNSWFSIVEP